jgi:hypothetical protein
MTPREQIENEENLRFPPTKSIANSIIRAGFKEGAEYGYNLAIENVVEWLCMNMTDTLYLGALTKMMLSKPELINNLKRAMRL